MHRASVDATSAVAPVRTDSTALMRYYHNPSQVMQHSRHYSCHLFLAVLFVAVCQFRAAAQTHAEQVEELLALYHDQGLFNGAALVAENGEVIFKGGFGDANMAWDIPNTPDTKFRIASSTKQFTAAVILRRRSGRIEGRICRRLPYPSPPAAELHCPCLPVPTFHAYSYKQPFTALVSGRRCTDSGHGLHFDR